VTQDPDCIFCKIVAQQIPSTRVYEDDTLTAFRDVSPQMPVHVLLVPNQHIANTTQLGPEHDALVGRLIRTAHAIATQEGVGDSGYRLVINTGPDSLNSVAHLHLHVLGGRKMGWPPG
jgi:histidine triad (HIT) family protein